MVYSSNNKSQTIKSCWMRWGVFIFGWLNVSVGTIGIFVPGLPTTVFLIIAFWAFSKSSKRFHLWIWTHPYFGEPVQNWHLHKIIPLKAKVLAVSMMVLSYAIIILFIAESWLLPILVGILILPSAIYVITHSSKRQLNQRFQIYET